VCKSYIGVWEFEQKYKRAPNEGEADFEKIYRQVLKKYQCEEINAPWNKLKQFARNFLTELSPSCAILGGFLAQELLKVISEKECPFDNFFCLDSIDSVGFVMQVK
jgi:ubiquitin-like 1-activating enzyme E1 A